MSAVVGIFYLDGRPVAAPELSEMLESLAHRGPDGSGLWRDGATGLGHRMLWTTPESLHEKLPLADRTGKLVITADARIDNRDELIDLLGVTDRPAERIGDSQLILAAYEKWGEQCVERLLGDFAFAIWDGRRQSLFCARDPLGVKHFYYHYSPGRAFVFASELKALLRLPFVPRRLNELSVAYHLLPVYDDKENTFYQEILRLPASHALTVDRDRLRLRPSWSPDLSKELRLGSNEEYRDAFREVFTESVRCRLRSAFPVGSMLSGGLDSSSITCVAGNLLAGEGRGPLHTFSAIWPSLAALSPKIDERPFMEAVIAMGGFDAHYIHADFISPLTEWGKIYWHEDNTLSAPNMYMDWAIFKSAHEHGARVLLGGTDGDTVVSYGYEDLAAFARRGRWLTLLRESAALSKNMPKRVHNFKQLVWKMGFKPIIPGYVKQGWRFLQGKSRVPNKDSALPAYSRKRPINAEFARRIGLEERLSDLYNSVDYSKMTVRETHWNDISSGDWAYILESFEKAGAAHSLEVRYPFFDRRLIEFCISLPPGQRLQNGYTRSILRRAMAGVLPPMVQWRTDKGNLSAGVSLKLLEYEKETLDDLILRDPGPVQDYVDMPSLRAVYERYTASPLQCNDEAFSLMLTATLALWLRSSDLSHSRHAVTSSA
jgi:asparagine synthase (glutamine-hydrolysing)